MKWRSFERRTVRSPDTTYSNCITGNQHLSDDSFGEQMLKA